jgi:anaerobic ribonucleoside-triphosphate reductase activating protein
MINIAAIQFPVFNPYLLSTCEIYLSGCSKKCLNCHNVELQSYLFGEQLNIEKLIIYLKEREKFFSIISITGGEPLDQNASDFWLLIDSLKQNFPNKQYWLFTSYIKEDIVSKFILESFDYIKVGEYKEELKQEGFPASSNQKLLKKGIDY